MMIVKALAVGLLIALAEVLNGNVRVRILHRSVGKKRARVISFFSGTLLIYAVCWVALPWLAPAGVLDCLSIGLVWVVVMSALDVYVGLYVFRFSWRRILDDLDPRQGNLLGLGLVLLFLCPLIVSTIQG